MRPAIDWECRTVTAEPLIFNMFFLFSSSNYWLTFRFFLFSNNKYIRKMTHRHIVCREKKSISGKWRITTFSSCEHKKIWCKHDPSITYVARHNSTLPKIPCCYFAEPSKHIRLSASASSAGSSAVVMGAMEMNTASPRFSFACDYRSGLTYPCLQNTFSLWHEEKDKYDGKTQMTNAQGTAL